MLEKTIERLREGLRKERERRQKSEDTIVDSFKRTDEVLPKTNFTVIYISCTKFMLNAMGHFVFCSLVKIFVVYSRVTECSF